MYSREMNLSAMNIFLRIMTEGWLKIYREIQDHWIWQDEKYLKWWLTIILNVNHEPKKFPVGTELFICYPGQSFRSIEQWTDMFSCSKPTTLKFFEMLKNDSMIKTEIMGKGNRRKHLLSVVNWEKYQQKETGNFTETVPETLPGINPNVPSNKNEKNEKNNRERKTDRFSPPSLSEIQKYFSEKITENGLLINPKSEAEKFESFYSSKNWMVGKNKMTDWKKAITGWIARMKSENPTNGFKHSGKVLKAL